MVKHLDLSEYLARLERAPLVVSQTLTKQIRFSDAYDVVTCLVQLYPGSDRDAWESKRGVKPILESLLTRSNNTRRKAEHQFFETYTRAGTQQKTSPKLYCGVLNPDNQVLEKHATQHRPSIIYAFHPPESESNNTTLETTIIPVPREHLEKPGNEMLMLSHCTPCNVSYERNESIKAALAYLKHRNAIITASHIVEPILGAPAAGYQGQHPAKGQRSLALSVITA